MKKLLIVLISILVLSTIAIFTFIPSKITVSESVFTHTTDRWASKYMLDSNAWHLWFPQQEDQEQFPVTNNMLFAIDSVYYNACNIMMSNWKIQSSSMVHLLSLKKDSLAVVWDMELEPGLNPVKRLSYYSYALQAKKSMSTILGSFKSFMDKTENIYGVRIERSKIPDTILISTKKSFGDYPSTEQVYTLLQQLNDHYSKFGASQVGNPMLNVSYEDGMYQTQVAIPIEKNVPETNDIKMKYMFRGNALKAEIFGGYGKIENALKAMTIYKNDFGLQSPAIPYQSLISNRMEEKDSSKWKTILYYPIR